MKYAQYLKKEDLLKKLLKTLGVLKEVQTILKIDNTPDNELIPTDWRDDDNNYFKNSWRFNQFFENVSEFMFCAERVYHFEHISDAALEIGMELDIDNIEYSLNQINNTDSSYFSSNGWDTDLDETFQFHKVRVAAIDNTKKKILYDGSFFGNHETYNNTDWGVFSKVKLTGIPNYLLFFYQELLGESYLLLNSGNYKMAYFLAYAAMENYVNIGLGSDESEERLKDKLNMFLKTKCDQLGKHEVYCGISAGYDDYTRKRNIIAHGKETIAIEKADAESVLTFVATLICSFEYDLSTFERLVQEIFSQV